METFREWLLSEVSQDQINWFSSEILNDLKNGSSLARIKGQIYWLLTAQGSDKEDLVNSLPIDMSNKYMNYLSHLQFGPEVLVKDKGSWYHITFPQLTPSQRKSFGGYKTTYKSYVTLDFGNTVDEVKQSVGTLLRGLPQFIQQIHQILLNNQDFGQVKIPTSLSLLIEHMDTIVVHYYKKETGQDIQDAARMFFPNLADRGIRASNGFDLKKDDNSASHSELVAWAIASEIISAKDKIIQQYDTSSLSSKLKERIQFWNNQDERALQSAYSKSLSMYHQSKQSVPQPQQNVAQHGPIQQQITNLVNQYVQSNAGTGGWEVMTNGIEKLASENPHLKDKILQFWKSHPKIQNQFI